MLKTKGYGKIVVADGKRFEMKIGPVYYNGIVYRPTTERFRQWYDIISTRPWFSRYDFWFEGSFANNLNLKPKWPTWDIDLTLTIKDEIYYNNIDQMNKSALAKSSGGGQGTIINNAPNVKTSTNNSNTTVSSTQYVGQTDPILNAAAFSGI